MLVHLQNPCHYTTRPSPEHPPAGPELAPFVTDDSHRRVIGMHKGANKMQHVTIFLFLLKCVFF